jgi:hypothetical protein
MPLIYLEIYEHYIILAKTNLRINFYLPVQRRKYPI